MLVFDGFDGSFPIPSHQSLTEGMKNAPLQPGAPLSVERHPTAGSR